MSGGDQNGVSIGGFCAFSFSRFRLCGDESLAQGYALLLSVLQDNRQMAIMVMGICQNLKRLGKVPGAMPGRFAQPIASHAASSDSRLRPGFNGYDITLFIGAGCAAFQLLLQVSTISVKVDLNGMPR